MHKGVPVLLHHLGKYCIMKRDNSHGEQARKPEGEYNETS